jgi:hypothetical protein
MVRVHIMISASLSSLLSFPVAAHDPFTDLRNAQGTPCCRASGGPSSDCKATISRIDLRGHLQAYIDERWLTAYGPTLNFSAPMWVDVPEAKILSVEKNPVAGDVVCFRPHLGVICFLPGRAM